MADTEVREEQDGMTTGQWVRAALLVGLLVLLTATSGLWGLAIVLGIVVMVFLHELGHYVTAKRAGMKVTEFFIGFGPRIWSFRRGETEYGVKLVPAGAYVRIIGMHNLEEVDPADEGRTYRQKPFRQRLAVAVAGSTMHFIIALVLIFFVLVGLGAPGGSMTGKTDASDWRVHVEPDSAADGAGLRDGDQLTAIDGRPTPRFEAVRPIVRPLAGEEVTLTVVRDGRTLRLPAVLGARDGHGFLGVGEDFARERVGPLAAVPRSFAEFGTITVESTKALGKFFTPGALSDFGDQVVNAREDRREADERESRPEGPSQGSDEQTRSEGDNRLLSLLGVFRIGTYVAEGGVAPVLTLFVFMNVFIGIFNLVPLLPFDGGHVAIATYEKVQELRLRRRARYFADVSRLLPLTYFVVMVLAVLFVTTTYVDLVNPFDPPR